MREKRLDFDGVTESNVVQIPIKKVALLGTVPHKLKAPFSDPSFEIWAIAHACLGDPLPRVDRIFEIHSKKEYLEWKSDDAWKRHPNIPVYLWDVDPDVPNSVKFPVMDVVSRFQIFPDRPECLQTNSISWMIALAILEGFREIHIYGVNMSHATEYGAQKPSCEYYLGLARGLGISIYVPTESDLCKSTFLYGFEDERVNQLRLKYNDRRMFLQNQLNNYSMQKMQMEAAMQQHIGALEELKFQESLLAP